MEVDKLIDGHDKEFLAGKDLSNSSDYQRPKAKDIKDYEYLKFM